MSPRFAAEDIDRVRETADIVEVVSEHVRLKKAGRSLVGLCPFHQEKTPSFNVDPDKGVYFCFGCQEGGSVFTFLEKIEGLSFPEAVDALAMRYGIQMREVSGNKRQPSPRAKLMAVHAEAVDRYHELLVSREGSAVREYLEERGIGPEQWERYRIGFGGWAKTGMVRHLTRKGYTSEELVSSGIATRDARGLRDTFWGRVLFPIFDPSDRPIAFGGRVLPEESRKSGAPDGPKYLNSRESPVFKKSKILYGTNWARGDVVRARRLVLVEGYTDVIGLHAAGIPEAVATCGTSLTEDHMKEISTRFGDVRVILCLDADAAGQQAMSRNRTEELAEAYSPGERVAGGRWLPVGRGWLPEVYVATLPEGKDPADFARAVGGDKVEGVLGDAVPLVRFLLARALDGVDLTGPEGRTRAVRKGAEILSQVGDSFLRHEYTLWLADRVGVDAFEVGKVVEGRSGGSKSRAQQQPPSRGPARLSGHQRVEREALRALAGAPEVFDDDTLVPSEEDFTLPGHKSIHRLVMADREEHGMVDIGRIAGRVADEELRGSLTELAVGERMDRTAAREVLVRLKGSAVQRRIEERKERLRSLDPDRDAEAYDALFEELLELERSRRTMNL